MAAGGLPFQIAADRRYDRSGDPRRLARAVRAGATVFMPQIHQVLPRVMRLMAALRWPCSAPSARNARFSSSSRAEGARVWGCTTTAASTPSGSSSRAGGP